MLGAQTKRNNFLRRVLKLMNFETNLCSAFVFTRCLEDADPNQTLIFHFLFVFFCSADEQIAEFDKPEVLQANPKSQFSGMLIAAQHNQGSLDD